jgi:hypothetical protein
MKKANRRVFPTWPFAGRTGRSSSCTPSLRNQSGEGGAKRRSAQAKRGRLGCLLRARGGASQEGLVSLLGAERMRLHFVVAVAMGTVLRAGRRLLRNSLICRIVAEPICELATNRSQIQRQAVVIATTLPSRRALISRIGGRPKNRLYSRLNWLGLS